MTEIENLQKKLARAEQRAALLEEMFETKTRELYQSAQEMRSKVAYQEALYRIIPNALVVASNDGSIKDVNNCALTLLGYSRETLIGESLSVLWDGAERTYGPAEERPEIEQVEVAWKMADGNELPVLLSVSYLDVNDDGNADVVCLATDLRERKQMEIELRHAQKLESVGQLAAGVAHEVNTPMQFIGDNVHFLNDAFTDLLSVIEVYSNACESPEAKLSEELQKYIEETKEEADLDYLRDRAPKAIERALDGIGRVTDIVAAMKAFSHPSHEKGPSDLNKAIENALIVAKNEYKYVADVEMDLGDLPAVVCNLGDLGQVFLNLIVNAAHAIQDGEVGGGEKGTIRVSSRVDGDTAVISIADSGCGIPEEVRDRIFDPFFTTKDVGRGTGQGLSLAHAVVAERHGGTLTFDTELGRGTTFHVRLPIQGRAESSSRVAA